MNRTGLQARPARRHAEIALRIVLTGLAIFFFYRTAMNFRAALAPPPDDQDVFLSRRWNQEPLDRTQQIQATAPLPWPRYPGSVVKESSIRPGSRSPFAIQDLSANGSAEEIIHFYRSAMKQRGWKDMSDQTFGIGLATTSGQVASQVGLQQEQFLRNFDGLRSSVLLMRKRDRRVMVTVEEGDRKWKKRVRLASFPERPMDALASVLDGEPVRGQRDMRVYPYLQRTDRYGPDEFNTKVLTSGRAPKKFFGDLEDGLEKEGWQKVEGEQMPTGSVQPGSRVGFYTRGTDGTLLVVTPVEDGKTSAASLTSIVGVPPMVTASENDSFNRRNADEQ